MQNPMYPWSYMPNQNVPIIKKYNISISNENGDLTKIHDLYEDVLPTVNGIVQKTLTTIVERMIMYQYLRSIFVKRYDGEQIVMGTNKINASQRSELTNLLSHIKLMELNPYHFSRLTNNPYKTLPDNFLMFRSCYPIRLNRNNNGITCAPDNIGLNIRIYQMKVLDLLAGKLGTNLKKTACDLWREIAYYEYIREHIIKPKRCPNFIMMHSWYQTAKSGIDFLKLKRLKLLNISNTTVIKQKNRDSNMNAIKDQNEQDRLEADNIMDQHKTLPNYDNVKQQIINILMDSQNSIHDLNLLNKQYGNNSIIVYKKKASDIQLSNFSKTKLSSNKQFNKLNVNPLIMSSPITTISTDIKFDLIDQSQLSNYDVDFPTTQCIVAITEAPTHNIYDWGTKSYSLDMGPIKKMVQTGYHDLKVWQSIMFQLLAAMHTMNLNDIYINEMKLENNVYIRDLSRDETQIGYWKYIVSGIEYYVPNYGYLVVIDTKYNQLEDNIDTINMTGDFTVKLPYSICGKIFEDDDASLELLKLNNLKEIFDGDNFKNKFLPYGGITPPKEIIDMMNEIKKSINILINTASGTYDETMDELFSETQRHFMNNRIGDLVKDIEKDQLIKDNQNFRIGDMVAQTIGATVMDGRNVSASYKWGLVIKLNNTTKQATILTKDDRRNYIVSNISFGDISKSYTPVEQNYKPNQKLTEDDILETYTVSKYITT
jgi:hypothetical protein